TIFALLNDVVQNKVNFKTRIFTSNIEESIYIPYVFFLISIVSFLIILLQNDVSLFSGKTVLWEEGGIIQIFWGISLSYVFLISLIEKRKKFILYSIVMLFVFFLTGDRTTVAISILAFIVFYFNKKEKQLLIKMIKILPTLCIFVFALFIFIGKDIYGSFQYRGLKGVYQTIIDKDLYLNSILNSEPFAIQNILNKVLQTDFFLGFDYLNDLPLQLLVVPSFFGADSQGFSETFRSTFYSFVDYGMAYNFWAEAYSIGKWPIVIGFILFFNFILLLLNLLLRSKDVSLKVLILLLGTYWSFYIHRNSLYTILTFERHHILLYIISLLSSFYIYIIFNKERQRGCSNG